MEALETRSPPDLEALRARVTAHLSESTGGPVHVQSIAPLLGGACQENFVVELSTEGAARRLVMRSDALSALPGSLARKDELAAITAAVKMGVPTPAARWLGHGLVREGAHAYFMDFIEGEALGGKIVRHPAFEGARKVLPEQLARAMAAIHRITPESEPELSLPTPLSTPRGGDPVASALKAQRSALDRLPGRRPALELALRWLLDHPPVSREVTLVHGDFRTGNFLVGQDGLHAVLDWEFCHFGAPLEDVAWLCVRDWRFGQVSLPAGGIADRATFYRLYAQASGREVRPADVHFWEVVGNLRWATGAIAQGQRYLEGGEPDLELVAIARRASEMELEALRLIEVGPPAL